LPDPGTRQALSSLCALAGWQKKLPQEQSFGSDDKVLKRKEDRAEKRWGQLNKKAVSSAKQIKNNAKPTKNSAEKSQQVCANCDISAHRLRSTYHFLPTSPHMNHGFCDKNG
jgi:hypothetical protein